MSILICCSGHFGGTDFLLKRYYEWLVSNGIDSDIVVPNDIVKNKRKKKYEVVILPSSQMNTLIKLKRSGYIFKSILIWIMGCGSFRDTFFNPDRNKGIEKIFNKIFGKLADSFVVKLYNSNSICFTDEVGMDISLQDTVIDYYDSIDNLIIPIAVKIPDVRYEFKKNVEHTLRLCWIGRVSHDFKVIPIKHLIFDTEEYINKNNKKIELTIVGDGDGLSEIKSYIANKSLKVNFVDSIDYGDIGDFLYENADILIAMGTSALDGAKYGCPSVIITPVKPSNSVIVNYRWIHESLGYSLGEYPDIQVRVEQIKKNFKNIYSDYIINNDISELSYRYAQEFDENKVFNKLYIRKLPNKITLDIWIQIYFYSIIKGAKCLFKKILTFINNKLLREE